MEEYCMSRDDQVDKTVELASYARLARNCDPYQIAGIDYWVLRYVLAVYRLMMRTV